jgi:hypothetical protein
LSTPQFLGGGVIGLAKTWPNLPAAFQGGLLSKLPISDALIQRIFINVGQNVVKYGTPLIAAVLVLSEATYLLVYRWYWKKDISGVQVAKRIADSAASTLGGLAGGFSGAAVGSTVAGPAGCAIGAVAGAVGGMNR